MELVKAAQQAGVPFRAVMADCCYGDNPGFTDALVAAKVPFVLALKPHKGTWAPADAAHPPTEAATELGWHGARKPGQWRRIQRRFRDGHRETWWAADATLGGFGPDRRLRLVVATTDPARLPGHSSWYLLTNLPRPSSRRGQQANLAEVVRRYGLRNWVEQGYKQVKGELGWADFQVRSDWAIRRHWTLVCCAFSFFWQAFLAEQPPAPEAQVTAPAAARGRQRPGIGAEPAGSSSWPAAVRAVRAWLGPWSVLARCWRSWSPAPPPRQLQRLLDVLAAGRPVNLYLPP